jgi:CheY-like chemotaxis protein
MEPNMARPSILLVDDDAPVLSMLRTVLGAHGYAVTTAISAADAKNKLAVGEFDMVLTDMRMEHDTAGYEVVRAASAKPEQPAIIILTAFPLLAQQWREAGAHHMLGKPTRITDLLDAMDKLLAVEREKREYDRKKGAA